MIGRQFGVLLVLIAMFVNAQAASQPRVRIRTNVGDIVVALFPDKAPVTVKNFLGYVDAGAYDGTIFHRVIEDFMIQGGGYTPMLEEQPEREPIRNEADNGLRNVRGTISMARLSDIDSAARQFFINTTDNSGLDHTVQSCSRQELADQKRARERGLYKPLSCKTFGYAVFGKVVEGMDVVDKISRVETRSADGFEDLPVKPIVIEKIERASERAKQAQPAAAFSS